METPNIKWEELGFGYYPTDFNVRCSYKDGKWGELRIYDTAEIKMNISSAVLHYAQEAFEGMKAFRGKDGKIRLFRPDENAKRLQSSCRGIMMPEFPKDKFIEACGTVVRKNKRFVPPYETGASLYLRPVLFGTTPLVGVKPADEYEFVVFATPVGPYFKGGFQTTPFMLSREYDRAAPLGTGMLKVGGNYAAGLVAGQHAHDMGYSSIFYLDPKDKKYIDECGAANFFAIRGNSYITPASHSILPSITNMSLRKIAEDMLGMTIERRQIPVAELDTFDEAGACGTAAVISPISKIVDIDLNKEYIFSPDGKPGPKCTELYHTLRGKQYGEIEDKFNWTTVID